METIKGSIIHLIKVESPSSRLQYTNCKKLILALDCDDIPLYNVEFVPNLSTMDVYDKICNLDSSQWCNYVVTAKGDTMGELGEGIMFRAFEITLENITEPYYLDDDYVDFYYDNLIYQANFLNLYS